MQRTLRKLLITAAMVTALPMGFLAHAATASAATVVAGSDACPTGATCAYTNINFTGTMGPVFGNNTNDRQYATWSGAESVSNNGTQCTDWVWTNEGYTGTSLEIPIHFVNSNLSGSVFWHHLWSNHWCNPT